MYKIDKGLCDLIEQLQYETNSYADLISFLIKENIDITSKSYIYLENQYLESHIQYEVAKRQLEEKLHVPIGASWILDFNTGVVTVNE